MANEDRLVLPEYGIIMHCIFITIIVFYLPSDILQTRIMQSRQLYQQVITPVQTMFSS